MENLITQKRWKVAKGSEMRYGEPFIPCRYGVIRQYDDGDLDIWTSNIRIANKISTIWTPKRRFDDGAFYIRPYSDLDQACQLLKARKRRRVTPEMRERGIRLYRYRKTILSSQNPRQSIPNRVEIDSERPLEPENGGIQ